MFRSALVALKPDRSDSVISFAVDLAKNYGLELGGLSVVDPERVTHEEAVPLGAGAYKAERDARQVESAQRLAQTVSHEFSSACELAGVRCESQTCDGDTVGELARAVLSFDVLVCGHTPSGDASDRSLLLSLLKHDVRPAIVVPRKLSTGSNVMLAYDASFQAARALATLTYSGILAKRKLHVVCLGDSYAEAATRSVSAMAFLKRQGIVAECHPEELVKDPAVQLLEAAARHDAGLIAMGAFGKGAVHEFFFGSVTRTMLETLSLPVLIDH